jgi:hypothetical protein
MAAKGFYLSIDATIGAGIAILVLTLLTVALISYSPPTHQQLANYKLVESAAYSLKGSGALGQMAAFIDAGNSSSATSLALDSLRLMNLPGKAQLELRLYSAGMASTHNFTASSGRLKKGTYTANLVFTTNSTSRYGIAMLRVGEEQ